MRSTTLTALLLCATLVPVTGFAKSDKDHKHDDHDKKSYDKDHKNHGDKHGDYSGYDRDRYDRDDNDRYDRDRDYKDREKKDWDYQNRDRYDAARYFDQDRRRILDQYYRRAYASNCPPGLAKKNNGCMPPGQYQKWQRNQVLPRDVRYYDLPDYVYRDLGRTYDNQKVVRVGGDILLINTATRLILDVLSGANYR